jgi:hypothetical protein
MAHPWLRQTRGRLSQLTLAGAACLVLACTAIEHGYETANYANRALATRGVDGAHRLQAEADLDGTVRNWIRDHGRPEYLYVVGRQKLYFFYTERDEAVMFEREFIARSKATELGRIPGHLLRNLPPKERERLVARRNRATRTAKARARARRSRARAVPPSRSAPAARAPGASGAYMSTFDLEEIVQRLRPPLTAADPGVRGWREGRLSDGRRRFTARAAGVRYEVRPDRISAVADMSAKTRHLSAAARLAVTRVNAAIFGVRADAVSDATLPLAEQVSKDRSGRTRFARRIQGRTVQITRVPARGTFVYSIHP